MIPCSAAERCRQGGFGLLCVCLVRRGLRSRITSKLNDCCSLNFARAWVFPEWWSRAGELGLRGLHPQKDGRRLFLRPWESYKKLMSSCLAWEGIDIWSPQTGRHVNEAEKIWETICLRQGAISRRLNLEAGCKSRGRQKDSQAALTMSKPGVTGKL